MKYRELVSSLPKPTPEQIRRFIDFVASEHSWYKLIFKRTIQFVFYLDPNAGRKIKKVRINLFRKAYRFIPLAEDQEARYYQSAYGY